MPKLLSCGQEGFMTLYLLFTLANLIFSSLSYQYIVDLPDRNVIRVEIRILANIY